MEFTEHQLNWILIFIPLLGLSAQWLAWYFRLPAIVLLTVVGLIFGPFLGVIQPAAQFGELLSPLIKVSVGLILFEGGLSLKLYEFREAANGVRRLVFPAVPIAWGLYSLCTHYIGGISWPISLIFGAIIVVSGPTVVIPLLRQAALKRVPASYIKWEGIINDPIGALLAVFVFQYFVLSIAGENWTQIFWSLLRGTSAALLLGAGGSYMLAKAFRNGLVPEYLKPPIVLGAVLIAYALSNAVQEEAGLLATTMFGMVLGNLGLPSIDEVRRFNESIGILLVSGVFILLTANLDVGILLHLNWRTLILFLAIIFLARPLTIFLATLGSKVEYSERILLACVAPRGIVAAAVGGVFAYKLEEMGVIHANMLVPMLFALIITTVVVYGFALPYIAKKLKLAAEHKNGLLIAGSSSWTAELANILIKNQIKAIIVDASWQRLKHARLLDIPYVYGQVLSEVAEEEIDMSEIGYVLAASDNDAFNALVCAHFAHKLGRNEVFQLPTSEFNEQDSRGGLNPALSGQSLFKEDYTFEDLLDQHYHGYTFQATKLTETYTPEQYEASAKTQAYPVLIIRGQKLVFFAKNTKAELQIDDVIISYSPHPQEETSSVTPPAQPDDVQ